VHRWYAKRFLPWSLSRQPRVLLAVAGIVSLQISHSALRVHDSLLDDEEVKVAAEAGDAKRRTEIEALGPGYPVGDPHTDIVFIDGEPYGREGDEEPDNGHIDTGHRLEEFAPGDAVWAWWWDLWWQATVQHVAARKGTLTIRWAWSHSVTSGYAPRLVLPRG
jgi:hypothetical protein